MKIEITISRNKKNEDYSIICQPVKLTVELLEKRVQIWRDIFESDLEILKIWSKQIWDLTYPNDEGIVLGVKILN